MMVLQHNAWKEKKVHYNLVETITDLQNEQHKQEMKISHLQKTNQKLWFMICTVLSAIIISAIIAILIYQKKKHKQQMKQADDKLAALVKKLNQTNAEKDIISQEIYEIMKNKDNRQEIETLTPSLLQKNGELKFRQRFELLYPLFISRLRERIPSITRREELLSMLIVLKQDNKTIAELMAIAPRSVLMLRHRFRQKIGLSTDKSLENFIDETINS